MNTLLPDVIMAGNSTNGLASGNTYAEAWVHSVLELIERASLKVPPVRVDGLEQQPLIAQASQYHTVRISYYANAYGIPTFKCTLTSQTRWDNQATFAGSGAHLSKAIALQRAVTEAIQSKVTTIAGSRDDTGAADYRVSGQVIAEPETTIAYTMIDEQPVQTVLQAYERLQNVLKHHQVKLATVTLYE